MPEPRLAVWNLLEGSGERQRAGRWCDTFLVSLIVLNALAYSLETVESVAVQWHAHFQAFEAFSVLVFTAEYALRLWAAPEDPRYADGREWTARRRFALSPLGIVDLLAFLPFFLAAFVPVDLRILRLLRLLRILKLARYSPALGTMATVLRNERRAVFGALCILAVLVVLSAAVMYQLEREAQPKAFGNIPQAMWWAVSTLTTVGYGDVTPITPAGRIVGSVVMFLGIGVFVLWTSIFAAGFIAETRKRNFVVTWKMVAQVPAFAGLDAGRIADIGQLLKPEVVPPRFTVIRRGEAPRAMFFVVSGELEVDMPTQIIHISEGQFFGEQALLEGTERRATVTSLTECQLLRLDRSDFVRLMEDEPDVRAAIERIANERARGYEATEI
jgi:voltage-gated potassium channel